MLILRRIALITGVSIFALACGDDDTSTDASTDASCAECDDGVFCNGLETCVAGMCRAGTAPCPGMACEEAPDLCVTECANGDEDGDGVNSIACGGDDCDDTDPNRFPGNTETCDAGDLDEDCDPSTFGSRDDDGDGYIDGRCCNGTSCGDDCDDRASAAHPGEAETCNNIDDDCDGTVDEGVLMEFVVDADRDGHASLDDDAETVLACAPPAGFAEAVDDCDDAVSSVHPGAFDRCDVGNVDDDCSGTPNDPPGGCSCSDGSSRTCPFPGVCSRSTQTCVGGAWADCSVMGTTEICGNGEDDDCDGAIDDGCDCATDFRFCGSEVGECGRGVQLCASDGSWGPCAGADDPAPETCNMLDDDCDGTVDEGVFVRCFADTDEDGYSVATATPVEMCASSCPVGSTATDPTDPAMRDCDPLDPRAFPGQTRGYATPRTSVGGFDFDCDGGVISTDTILTSCVEDAGGMCFGPMSGLIRTASCGTRITYIACSTETDSSGSRCDQVYTCLASSMACGDQNQVKCR